MEAERPIVIAEGSLSRLEELKRLLAAAQIPAEVLRPAEKLGNK
ncbi:hypothetical protein [Engelhardtia mirabilis]|uniref:Uncharacterized protein n=1 Tax=Engelhardtia mirabilis TaxID=2528011 RepID=A0A518BDM7_9BACT|nr:hypothetical protein Pla133_01290 [Planctomycetes bacterium Pla133]QDU99392.1 hypothetical protein Pla86_01290 [Planctomycetes bacterium Pla86]